MSLKIKYHGVEDSLFTLSDEGFTKTNLEAVAGANPPYGVLGGSIAAVSSTVSYQAVPADGTNTVIGLFLNNAEGAPFENDPARASGKVAIVHSQAVVEVDIYASGVTFALGDKLYSDANGYLTNVESTNKQVIGVCTKLPTASDPYMGVALWI